MEPPSPKVFSALLSGDVKRLCSCLPHELRPFLPCLARIALSSPATVVTSQWQNRRKAVHVLIAGIREVNALKESLAVDFQELKQDSQKERQLLKKLNPGEERSQSILASSLQYGLAIEFERSDHLRRFRLFLSEILRVMRQVESPFKLEQSDLFECKVHLEEVGDIMCIAAAELPSLLPVVQVAEALLRLEMGPYFLCRLIANMPDHFDQVVTSLVLNGESLDEVTLAGRCRTTAVRMLCHMHPARSSYVQSLAMENCKHPTLALSLALEAEDLKSKQQGAVPELETVSQAGVATLLYNIIITGNEQTKAWFAQYMKLMQQKFRRQKFSAVSRLRRFLMRKFLSFMKRSSSSGMELGPDLESDIGIGQDAALETMETEMVIESNGVEVGKTEDVLELAETVMESSTLEDLVDQMEIVISEQEGTEGAGAKEKQEQPATKSEVKVPHGEQASRRRRFSSSQFKINFPLISMEKQMNDDEIIELMSLLHVCCGLKVQAQMYLTNEETAAILSLIACTCPPFSPAGVRFIEITLCILLACPFLISLEECEHAVVRWFQWLLEKLPDFDQVCGSHCSYGEMLLLVAIHLREKQLGQIEELISSAIQMKVSSSLRSGHFNLLRQLFLKVFTDDVVCAHAVSVPPTHRLSARMSGYLPVHCVHQLIKTRTFRKHGISIKDWIYQQLLDVTEPLHPTLPLLIQEFVNSVLLPNAAGRGVSAGSTSTNHSPFSPRGVSAGSTSTNHSPFSPRGVSAGSTSTNHSPFAGEEVLKVFRSDTDTSETTYPIPSQLLMLYYVLLYQDCYLTNLKTLLMQPGSNPSGYSPGILAQIPMKQLLHHASQHQQDYVTLYPSLLRLTATHLPHLCLVDNWLKEEESTEAISFVPVIKFSSKKINPASAKKVLQQLRTSPSKALLLLTHLSTLSPTALLPYTPPLITTLTLLLSPTVPRRIQALYPILWTKLNTVIPRRLWLETVNALRPLEMQALRPLTHQNLTEDPLTVLRCDPRVFRCPPVFEILLRILAAYTSASKAWLQEHAHTQNCIAMATTEAMTSSASHATKQEREELCISLTAAQESAIIQLLLETCLPNEEDKKAQSSFGPQLSALQETQCLVCSYLHQAFIAEPSMVKLIHFQGYPSELLPVVVSGVPSIHISLDFIPELLGQPQTDKQQFAVQLAAQVIHQYPLPDAMGIARDIFKRLMILANEIPVHMREKYFQPLLPSVVKLCQTFPPLCSEATEFLVHLSKMCASLQETLTDVNSQEQYCRLDGTPHGLLGSVQNTFQEVVNSAVVKL